MMSVKLRKVGHSITLTVPNNIKPMATEYDVYQGRDGQIVYTPKQKNIFLDDDFAATHDFTQKEAIGGLVKNELPQD